MALLAQGAAQDVGDLGVVLDDEHAAGDGLAGEHQHKVRRVRSAKRRIFSARLRPAARPGTSAGVRVACRVESGLHDASDTQAPSQPARPCPRRADARPFDPESPASPPAPGPARSPGGDRRPRAAPPRPDRPRPGRRRRLPRVRALRRLGRRPGRRVAEERPRDRGGPDRVRRAARPGRLGRRARDHAPVHLGAGRPERRGDPGAGRRCCSPLRPGPLGLGPAHPARHGYFVERFYTVHGGVLGEGLYWSATTLFQRLGAQILAVLMFVSGVLLLTGTTVSALLSRAGRMARTAGAGTRELAKTVRTGGPRGRRPDAARTSRSPGPRTPSPSRRRSSASRTPGRSAAEEPTGGWDAEEADSDASDGDGRPRTVRLRGGGRGRRRAGGRARTR